MKRAKAPPHPAKEHYVTGTGQKLLVHAKTQHCITGCAIHYPSHHMAAWKTNWRDDRGLMERLCVHGVGHPDPDAVAYIQRTDPETGEAVGVHGCDGCCKAPVPPKRSRKKD